MNYFKDQTAFEAWGVDPLMAFSKRKQWHSCAPSFSKPATKRSLYRTCKTCNVPAQVIFEHQHQWILVSWRSVPWLTYFQAKSPSEGFPIIAAPPSCPSHLDSLMMQEVPAFTSYAYRCFVFLPICLYHKGGMNFCSAFCPFVLIWLKIDVNIISKRRGRMGKSIRCHGSASLHRKSIRK